jgi:uncharacterized protein (DUF305 family)
MRNALLGPVGAKPLLRPHARADGKYQPAIDLATNIRDDQLAEIAEMEQLLTQL